MELLLEYVRYYVNLSPEAQGAFVDAFREKSYKKDHILLHEGDTCRNLYFLLEGTLRTYYHQEGKDITTWIYPESYFVTAWTSFLRDKPSFEGIEVVEDSKIAFISRQTLNHLYEKFQGIERFGRLLAEEQLSYIDEYSKGYYFLSAREKYNQLISFFPDVTQRINLGHIASLLGITQETLSRIRRSEATDGAQ